MFFWKRWLKFVKEAELEIGDSLALFTELSCEPNIINAYICKGNDKLINKDNGNTKSTNFHNLFYLS